MAENRGKKGKKARWQVNLGLKEAVFAGLGVAGLLMMCFALGTLAGRGDIYRVLQNWGLLGPENLKMVQIPPSAGPPALPTAATATPGQPQVPPNTASTLPSGQAQITPAAPPAPGQGDIAAGPSASHAAKKKSDPKEAIKKDETVKKIKKEVAPKLKFLNEQDKPAAKTGAGDKQKGKEKGGPTQVFVAKYRDGKRAQAKLAEMRKQGDQVSLKEGKDGEGPYFAIYRQLPASSKTPVVAQTQTKSKKTPAKSTKTTGQP